MSLKTDGEEAKGVTHVWGTVAFKCVFNLYTPDNCLIVPFAGVNLQTTAAIAKELLKGGNSPTAEALVKGTHKNSAKQQQSQSSQAVRPKDQLLYLAQLLGFQVQFSDFPKVSYLQTT